jgi:hypothetical protein
VFCNRAGAGTDIVESVSVQPEVGFLFASIGRGVDFVKKRPVCRVGPDKLIVGWGRFDMVVAGTWGSGVGG